MLKMKKPMLALSIGLLATVSVAAGPDEQQTEDVMARVVKAYEAPKAFSSTTKMTISFSGDTMNEEFSSRFGADGSMQLSMPNIVITVLDGYVYGEITGMDTSYLKRPVGKGVASTLTSIFGGPEIVPYDLKLRTGDSKDWLQGMTFGLLVKPKITGVTMGKDEKGNPATILEITDPNGEARVYINPETMFFTGMDAQITDPAAPEGMSAKITMTIDSKASEKLAKPITFDPKDRKAVDSIEDLLQPEPKSIADGTKAPGFSLPQLKGEEVSLASLKGKIVVLDFWATWCGPCRKGLPLVQKFADWAKDKNDVVVYAVNVWERGNDEAAIIKTIDAFWTKEKFTMPTLMSFSDKITKDYGVSGIPVTVVIDKDGNIAEMHRGYSPNLFEELKAEIEKLRGSGT